MMSRDVLSENRGRVCGFVGADSVADSGTTDVLPHDRHFGESFYVTEVVTTSSEIVTVRYDALLAEKNDSLGRKHRTREIFKKTSGGIVVGLFVRRRTQEERAY